MPKTGVINVPANSEKGGKSGIAGSNVRTVPTPPLPSHFGGSKAGK
jgi:hypothetical protein